MGFFSLMWFTWLETSLFDVRFSIDSVLNRVFKAVSFGVMTGFAIVGASFDTSRLQVEENEYDSSVTLSFRSMALILMVSRLALAAQYGVILWYVRGFKRTFLPLALTVVSLLVAAMVFLGTYFGFPENRNIHTYIGWYV